MEFTNSSGKWKVYSGECPEAVSKQFCYVSKSNLTSSPFNFERGDSLRVRISAKNKKGWNKESTADGKIKFRGGGELNCDEDSTAVVEP